MDNSKENRLAGHEADYKSTQHNNTTHEHNFKDALDAAGLITSDPIIPDGKIHRIHVKGEQLGSKKGWYVFYPNEIPTGVLVHGKQELRGLGLQRQKTL